MMVVFIAWWVTFLGATALLVGWQWRLAIATSAAATALVFLVGALILAFFPPAPVGHALGILFLVAWGGQCRERWAELGTGEARGGEALSRVWRPIGARVAPRQRGRG